MKYRAEIDGLRAIAVIGVILYHADLSMLQDWFSGGFLGVDVFFVISGYLITSLILTDVGADRFSFSDFYLRRARRLLPALFVVTLFTIATGWWLMSPAGFDELTGSIIAALLFVSNFFFLFQDAYTAEAAPLKPFLHTWSLAVEEQFYLIFPLFLVVAWRYARQHLFIIVGLLGLLSFGLAVAVTATTNDIAFYLLPTRIWELIAGALIGVAEFKGRLKPDRFHRAIREVVALLGLLLIGLSFVLLDDTQADPSWHTLMPIVGSVLVIVFASHTTLTRKLLASSALVGCGLISYSLYLWHQPLLAFLRIGWIGNITDAHTLIAIVVAFMAAYLSWRYIEKPTRNPGVVPTKSFLRILPAGLLLVVLAGLFQNIGPANTTLIPDSGVVELTPYTPGESVDMLLIGDSHADRFGKALNAEMAARNLILRSKIKYGCPWVYAAIQQRKDCNQHNAALYEALIDSDVQHVFVVSRYTAALAGTVYTNAQGVIEPPYDLPRWRHRESGKPAEPRDVVSLLEKDLLALVAAGKQVYMVTPTPELAIDPVRFWQQHRDQPPIKEPFDHYLARNEPYLDMLARLADRIHVIEVSDVFCDTAYCYANRKGWLYTDDDHLSHQAAIPIVERLMRVVDANQLKGQSPVAEE